MLVKDPRMNGLAAAFWWQSQITVCISVYNLGRIIILRKVQFIIYHMGTYQISWLHCKWSFQMELYLIYPQNKQTDMIKSCMRGGV